MDDRIITTAEEVPATCTAVADARYLFSIISDDDETLLLLYIVVVVVVIYVLYIFYIIVLVAINMLPFHSSTNKETVPRTTNNILKGPVAADVILVASGTHEGLAATSSTEKTVAASSAPAAVNLAAARTVRRPLLARPAGSDERARLLMRSAAREQ